DLVGGVDPVAGIRRDRGVEALHPQVLDLDVDEAAVTATGRDLEDARAGRRAQRRPDGGEGGDRVDPELLQDVDAVQLDVDGVDVDERDHGPHVHVLPFGQRDRLAVRLGDLQVGQDRAVGRVLDAVPAARDAQHGDRREDLEAVPLGVDI